MAIDLKAAETRARRAYELGRARRGALLAAPLAILAVFAAAIGDVPTQGAAIGTLLYLGALVFHWRGQEFEAAVLPGAAAGLVPLALGLTIRTYGCMGGCTSGCMAFCIPASLLAGAVAGLLIAQTTFRTKKATTFVLSAGVVALLTGALGCACIGLGGLLGLTAGIALPIAASLARLAASRSS